jgi:hypothetical protein
MSVGPGRGPGLLVRRAHLEELELLPMCRRSSGLNAGHVDRDQPPAMTQRSMAAVMTRPLHPGADLFRLRRCPHDRYDAS